MPFTALSVALSKDGQYIAVDTERLHVNVFRAADGASMGSVYTGGSVVGLEFSPDSQQLLVGDTNGGAKTLKTYALPSLLQTGSSPVGVVPSPLRFSANGRWLSIGGNNGSGQVLAWPSLTPVTFEYNSSQYTTLYPRGFAGDQVLGLLSFSFNPLVFDCNTGQAVRTLPYIGDPPTDLSPDGQRYATYYHTVRNALDGSLIANLDMTGVDSFYQGPLFSPNGQYLVAAAHGINGQTGDRVTVWGSGYQRLPDYLGHGGASGYGPYFAFSSDSSSVVSAVHDVHKWHLGDQALERDFTCHSGIDAIAVWSPNGSKVASGSSDYSNGYLPVKGVRIWNSPDGALLSTLPAGTGVTALAWIDENRVAVGYDRFGQTPPLQVWHWDGSSWAVESEILNYGRVNKIIACGSNRLATKGWQQPVRLVDWQTGQVLGAASPTTEYNTYGPAMCMNSSKTAVLVGGTFAQGTGVHRFSVTDLSHLGFDSMSETENELAVSPNDRWLAHGRQQTLFLRNLVTNQEVQIDSTLRAFSADSIQFSPDSRYLLVGSFNDIRYYRVTDGARVALYEGQIGFTGNYQGARSVGFSPDGTKVVVGRWDASVLMTKNPFGPSAIGPAP